MMDQHDVDLVAAQEELDAYERDRRAWYETDVMAEEQERLAAEAATPPEDVAESDFFDDEGDL